MRPLKTQLITVFVVCATAAHVYGNDIQYTVTDLGTLGGPTSVANAISQNGIIVGGAEVPQRGDHPFVYQGNGPMQDIGLLDPANGIVGVAKSVNSNGQVVGQSDAAGTNEPGHAFYYVGSGSPIDLGTLGGQSSIAMGINEIGQIAGYAQTGSGAVHGTLWTVGGATMDLGAGFLATAINNQGLIGGVAVQTQSAALYKISSGSVTNLGPLTGGTPSQVNGMSNGFAVGFADSGSTSTYGFVYDINAGILTDLVNPVSPLWACNAAGVNDLGQVVGGYALDANYEAGAAFLYNQTGGIQNLNDLIDQSSGWDLTGCGDINDRGQIVGSGYNPQGEFHAFLLTPVPEPSTFMLLWGAVFGFLAIRRGARLMK